MIADPGGAPPIVKLLSVHPRYAAQIFTGAKTVEFRRRWSIIGAQEHLFLYATAPQSAIVGRVSVALVRAATPEHLATLVDAAYLSDDGLFSYFENRPTGTAIFLRSPCQYVAPISLKELRETFGVSYSRSYRRLSPELGVRLDRRGVAAGTQECARVLAVFGISGVGKSELATRAALLDRGLRHVTASQFLSSEEKQATALDAIIQNQWRIVRSFLQLRACETARTILLDAHNIVEANGRHFRVPVKVLAALGINAAILLTAPPETVLLRRKMNQEKN